MSYKPDGYNSLSPYLVVDDPDAVMAFLERVLGAKRLRRFEDDEGGVVHAEIRVDDTVVMIGGASEEWPAMRYNLHVYVPDVDATFQAALDAGAEAIQAPEQKDDPDRRCGVRGPGGNAWWFATQVG